MGWRFQIVREYSEVLASQTGSVVFALTEESKSNLKY